MGKATHAAVPWDTQPGLQALPMCLAQFCCLCRELQLFLLPSYKVEKGLLHGLGASWRALPAHGPGCRCRHKRRHLSSPGTGRACSECVACSVHFSSCTVWDRSRTSHHRPLICKQEREHYTTTQTAKLVNASFPKNLPLGSKYPALLLLLLASAPRHEAAHPRLPSLLGRAAQQQLLQQSQPWRASPAPAPEQGSALCPCLPSQTHTNMCTQGITKIIRNRALPSHASLSRREEKSSTSVCIA